MPASSCRASRGTTLFSSGSPAASPPTNTILCFAPFFSEQTKRVLDALELRRLYGRAAELLANGDHIEQAVELFSLGGNVEAAIPGSCAKRRACSCRDAPQPSSR